VAERTIVEFEKPRQIDAEMRDILDFKIRHNIPMTTGECSALVDEDPATTTRKRVSGGDTPPFVRFGRKVRYLPSIVLPWLADRPVYRSTSEPEARAG
jgi:hypothetical protein